MLMAVSHENIDVLIKATSGYDFSIMEAIKALATDSDKEKIMTSLNSHPALVNVVTDRGWVNEARATLVIRLRTNPQYLPPEWIEAVAPGPVNLRRFAQLSYERLERLPDLPVHLAASRHRSLHGGPGCLGKDAEQQLRKGAAH
jgi:hypothetical protein